MSSSLVTPGNVGIDNTNPQNRLDVTGNIGVSGNIYNANTTSGGEFKITTSNSIPICIGSC
jgi:hypothetical protein